ncbi:hypothetical protein OBBRIDRAFT_839705 [Obba rivulosa]|uniref:Uncharacterized protein n=1 Tax=Obba rivulosa TaxID=1052685 RepID=A0A8E2AHT4_9APHY|nr:hypothetical protein OBBRIDRAFT_839705 [Obba rivulosa]
MSGQNGADLVGQPAVRTKVPQTAPNLSGHGGPNRGRPGASLLWGHSGVLVDPTTQARVPFVTLIHAVDEWRAKVTLCVYSHFLQVRFNDAQHDKLPSTTAENEFKAQPRSVERELDEENFDEAQMQARRV